MLWLFGNDFEPFGYAMAVHGDHGFADAAASVLGYLGGSAAYVAIPVHHRAGRGAAQPARHRRHDLAGGCDRRLAAASFWAPLLLPVPVALVSGTEITSLWSMSAWTLLPILLLSPDGVVLREIDTRRLVAAAVVLPLVALIASPFIAINVQRHGPPPASAQAPSAGRRGRAPVAADNARSRCASSPASSILPTRSRLMPPTGRACSPPCRCRTRRELARSGRAIVCFAEDAGCRSQAPAGAQRVVTEIVRNFLRVAGPAAALHDFHRAAAAVKHQ